MTNARKLTDKLFGGIKMTWLKVIVFAVVTAIVTAVFLILPIFDNTSFREMGTTLEAWILFAIIIMTNCEKPLESALKTFVFFLISQPLIYLFQVPFAAMGWELFGYYRFWFIWTLLTFPMAFVGWYLKKRNWLSLLILSPILCGLAFLGFGYAKQTVNNFPNHLIAAVFCFGQILLYLYAFFYDWKQRLVGLAVPIVVIAVFALFVPAVDMTLNMPLPDVSRLSDSAVISLEDSSYGTVEILDPGEGYINLHALKYGSTVMTVTDGDHTYLYDVEIKDDNGIDRVEVIPKDT